MTDAEGMPERAMLSLRVGDVRKQGQFKVGEAFKFEVQSPPRHVYVDIFQKVGSKQVNIADLAKGVSNQFEDNVVIARGDSSGDMRLGMQVNFSNASMAKDYNKEIRSKSVKVKEDAQKAKSYLDDHGVGKMLQDLVQLLLREQPADPRVTMLSFVQAKQGSAPAAAEKGIQPIPETGGVKPPPTPATLPDLSGHNSVVAIVLRENPDLYYRLQDVRTPLGVPLYTCAKPGLANKGHKIIKSAGLVAGDAECYTVFGEVFRPVLERFHGLSFDQQQPSLMDHTELDATPVDPRGGHLLSTQVTTSRNLEGFSFLPGITEADRREVERVVVSACRQIQGSFAGDYFPVQGSNSYVPKPGGAAPADEHSLRAAGLCVEKPDSAVAMSAGLDRDWPEARGTFASADRNLALWINEADHIKLISRDRSENMQAAFGRLSIVESSLRSSLLEGGYKFARSDIYGFLTTAVAEIGTAMQVSAVVKLPLLGAEPQFKQLCKKSGLAVRLASSSDGSSKVGVWELTNGKRLGCIDVAQMGVLVHACRRLIELEARLEDEELLDLDAEMEAATYSTSAAAAAESLKTINRPGLGNTDYPGFPSDVCPEVMPNLKKHCSLAAEVMRKDSSIYDRLKSKRSRLYVPFAQCVKTAFDNQGHPMIKTVGAVAGDASCYDEFQDFFDPLIKLRHPGYEPATSKVPELDMDSSKLQDCVIDATRSGRVVSTELSVSRNLAGLRMSPACSLEERREVERAVVEALWTMCHGLEGEYFPSAGSTSYPARPKGISQKQEAELAQQGITLEVPDSDVMLSSGYGRHWPDARGTFVGSELPTILGQRQYAVWINEEDHLRMATMQPGDGIKDALDRLNRLHSALEAALQQIGHSFSRSDRLGYLGACPSNLGTCMAARVTLQIPLLGAHKKFRTLCKSLQLQVRGRGASKDEGLWEVTNLNRLGSSEIQQVNDVVAGCQALLEYEMILESGGELPGATSASPAAVQKNPATSLPPFKSEFSDMPGLGEDDYPGFNPASCQEESMVTNHLSNHHTIMADILRSNPQIYTQLKHLRTSNGVTLARCIKPGMDIQGHPMIKSVGAVIADSESLDVFGTFFDALVNKMHPELNFKGPYPCDCDISKLSRAGQHVGASDYIIATQIKARRNLSGMPLGPAIDREQRCKVERVLTKVLHSSLAQEFAGEYFPLTGSASYPSKPAGMSTTDVQRLEDVGFLFQEPDAPLVLSSGIGRHWPEARGVYAASSADFAAWINYEDHMNFIIRDKTLNAAFERFCAAESRVRQALLAEGFDFARNSRMGYVTTCPSNLGTGLDVEVQVRLPHLGANPRFRQACKRLHLQARKSPDGHWLISSADRIGCSEVEQVNAVSEGVAALVDAEICMARGETVDVDSIQVEETAGEDDGDDDGNEWMDLPGLGAEEVPGFPADKCPDLLPDLSQHTNLVCDVFRQKPDVYDKLKPLKSTYGVSLAKCIKPGMDNKGHAMLRTVGVVAGDASCYDVFADLFDPILAMLTSTPGAHQCVLDPTLVSAEPIDPTGKYLVSARLRCSRNISTLRFPTAISREERCEVERIVTTALDELCGDFAGDYHPLQGSTSYPAVPNGMEEAIEEELDSQGLLFVEPDSSLRLSSGTGRHWPEARGVFASRFKNLAIFVNEEDHVRFVATARESANGGLRGAFEELCHADRILQMALRQQGHDYAFTDRLGFLTSDPSNVGTGGLRASLILRLPLLGTHAKFKVLCKSLGVHARLESSADSQLWNVQQSGKLGTSEVDLLNKVSAAGRRLVECELLLQQGSDLPNDLGTAIAALARFSLGAH